MRLASGIVLAIFAFAFISPGLTYAMPGPAELVQASAELQKNRPDIWVFEPFTSQSKKELEAFIVKTFPGGRVSIFTRFRDFRKALGDDLPDAVLTRPLVLDAFPTLPLEVQISGSQSGSSKEPFAFIAHKSLKGKDSLVLGAVDIKGRKETSAWLAKTLPHKQVRLKAVSKMEDLMSLLLFDYVDAIVVPVRDVAWFQSRTEKVLHIQENQFQVGLPVLATMPEVDCKAIIQSMKSQDLSDKELGVERWVRPTRTRQVTE